MMSNPSVTNEEITPAIQDLRNFITTELALEFKAQNELHVLNNIMADLGLHRDIATQKNQLFEQIKQITQIDDKEVRTQTAQRVCNDLQEWEEKIKKFGRQYTKDVKKLKEVLDYGLSYEVKEQIRLVKELLQIGECCYNKLTELISLTEEFPYYKKDPNKFKKELIKGEISRIKQKMPSKEVTNEDITCAIQDLRNFIIRENKLDFQGEAELLTLNNMIADLDSHREIYTRGCKLLNLIRNIMSKEDKEEAKKRIVGPVKADLEEWKKSAEKFGEQYTEDLEELQKELDAALLYLG